MWALAALLAVSAASAAAGTPAPTPCAQARTRCVYRTGCGAALSNYMMMCEGVVMEPAAGGVTCPQECSYALIALTSTEEGKELMNCECEDEYCLEAKQRIDICRPQVLTANATSSCTLSQLICIADAQCATALAYYHQFCRSMFRGRKCSNKCLNSIEILRKQEKAAALTVCQCDGNEDYDCPQMQSNLERLCFHKKGLGKNHDRSHAHEKHKKPPKEQVVHDAANKSVLSALLLICVVVFSFNT